MTRHLRPLIGRDGHLVQSEATDLCKFFQRPIMTKTLNNLFHLQSLKCILFSKIYLASYLINLLDTTSSGCECQFYKVLKSQTNADYRSWPEGGGLGSNILWGRGWLRHFVLDHHCFFPFFSCDRILLYCSMPDFKKTEKENKCIPKLYCITRVFKT